MSRGIRRQCPHCQYKHWNSSTPAISWEQLRAAPPAVDRCERCRKDMNVAPAETGYETVCINGRMVRRKKGE